MTREKYDIELELWHFPLACSRATLIALEEIGCDYKTHILKIAQGEMQSPEFLALNPKGQIPILVVNRTPLTESVAIFTFLANEFPGAKLLPASTTLAAAKATSLLAFISSTLHPIVSRLLRPQRFCDIPDAMPRVKELATTAMSERLTIIEKMLGEHQWLCSADWTVVDAYFYWIEMALLRADFDLSAWPKIKAHYDRVLERPSVVRALQKDRNDFEAAQRGGFNLPPGTRYL